MIFTDMPNVEINGIEIDGRDAALKVVKPDPSWTFRDPAGHFHAFSDAQENDPYPTLRRQTREVEHSACDCGCDDWTDVEVWYECRICGFEVEPEMVEWSPVDREVAPGRSSWHYEITVPNGTPLPRNGDFCTVRVCEPKHEFFGVATVVSSRYSGMDSMVLVMLYGSGPLGRRTIPDPR